MISKLFTPKVSTKRGNVLDAAEAKDMFGNVPVHAEVPDTFGATTPTGHPLRMSSSSQEFTGGISRRIFRTKNETGEY